MNTPSPTQTETLFGGAQVSLVFRDGTHGTVLVKQLSIDEFPKLLGALDNELAQVELYCDRPMGWAKTLSPESHELVITEGDRLNTDFFSRWLHRQMARQERVRPGMTEKLLEQATERLLSQALQNGSPKPPSSAA